jgi:hypothetical protein
MSEGAELIELALKERRSLETALAKLVAKHNRFPSPELARMIRGIESEIIQRRMGRGDLTEPEQWRAPR